MSHVEWIKCHTDVTAVNYDVMSEEIMSVKKVIIVYSTPKNMLITDVGNTA